MGGLGMDIGSKIKSMRMEKQLTQEELANRCELSKGFISQLENNLMRFAEEQQVPILLDY